MGRVGLLDYCCPFIMRCNNYQVLEMLYYGITRPPDGESERQPKVLRKVG